jgi:hypothetical protein
MNQNEQELLMKLGIVITDLEYDYPEPSPYDGSYGRASGDVTCHGTFTIDESRFRPMCNRIKIVDMIAESKNPMVSEQFHHLITLLELTKEN